MPQIKEYISDTQGLRPTNLGVDATAAAARRVGGAYNEAGAAIESVGRSVSGAINTAGDVAVTYFTNRDVSQGAAEFAKKNEKLTNAWNAIVSDKNTDPNDPTIAQRFREEVLEPEIEKFKQGFWTEGGQKWAESHTQSLRTHMYQKTAADMSTLAAASVRKNVSEISNRLSNTAMRDPSSVDYLLGTMDSSVSGIVGSSPNLKGADASKARIELSEKMKAELVKAGAIGAIQQSADPEKTADAWAAKYPQYISGADIRTLAANARQQIRAARTDRAYSEQLRKAEQQDVSDQREVTYLQKLYSDKPEDKSQVSTRAIVNDPNLTRQSKERMIGIVERELKPETASRVSNGNYIEILGKIRSGEISDVDPIYKARQENRLSKSDFTQALKDFTEYKSPQGEALGKDRSEFFKRYAPTIDQTMGDVTSMQFGRHSALGMQKMYEAEKAARRMEEDLRKAGKDPHGVYDPSSPDFFGKPANIMKYRATMQDAVNYQKEISKADTAAAPTALPAVDKREVGKTYPTARGPMKWTGTGWVAP